MPCSTSRSSLGSPSSSSEISETSGRYRTSTGYVRPETSTTGASTPPTEKCREKLSGSIVALVTITLRSGRRGSSCLRYPSRKSTVRFRSCASSMMIAS